MVANHILSHVHNAGFSESDTYGAYKIFFGTLVSGSRLRIINLLRSGRKNVGQIVSELGADQTSVSHDLSRLKLCGFVNVEIEGKFRYYSLNESTIKPLMEIIDSHMSKNCIHILKGSREVGHEEHKHLHQ